MWIMMIKKIPTNPSPPKMSMHWSIPWPHHKYANIQFAKIIPKPGCRAKKMPGISKGRASILRYGPLKFSKSQKLYFSSYFSSMSGAEAEPHWAGARKIHYKDEQIRVFPHEFSIITTESMNHYITESHEFVPGTVAERAIMFDILDGDARAIYDAALLDCNESQAFRMAMGIDVRDESKFPPPIGWYKIRPEYGNYFCNENELKE